MDKDYRERNKNINRGYRNLDIWIEGIELYVLVRKKLKELADNTFKTKAQIEASILSVPSNIAEGYSRRSLKENIQFINYSLASLSENYTQIFALFESKDLDKDFFDEYDKMHYSLENKLINFNKSMVGKLKNKEEWKNDYIMREIVESYDSQ